MCPARRDFHRKPTESAEEAGSAIRKAPVNNRFSRGRHTKSLLYGTLILLTMALIEATNSSFGEEYRATPRLKERYYANGKLFFKPDIKERWNGNGSAKTHAVIKLLLVLLVLSCTSSFLAMNPRQENAMTFCKSPSSGLNSTKLTRSLLHGFFQSLDSTGFLKYRSSKLDIFSDNLSENDFPSKPDGCGKVTAGRFLKSTDQFCSYGQEYFVYPVFQNSIDRYVSELRSETPVSIDEQMKYELVRLSTFSNFPQDSKAFPIRLAQAGFHYTGDSDTVSCFSCSVSQGNWKHGENPVEVHRRISPDCPFLNGTDTRNVAVREKPTFCQNAATSDALSNTSYTVIGTKEAASSTLSSNSNRLNTATSPNNDTVINRSDSSLLTLETNPSRRDHDLNSLGVCHERPKYPRYAVNAIRVSSFSGWPPYMSQTPESLASAGLFYAGFADCVRCFHCGGGLRNFDEGDIPWVEHARWYPKCSYVKQCKGEKFIQDVINAAQEQSLPAAYEPEEAAATDPKSASTLTDPFSTPAVLSVLEMGYSRDIIREAVSRIEEKGSPLKAERIMEHIFSIEMKENADVKEAPIENNSKLMGQSLPEGYETLSEDMQNSIMQENRELKEKSVCKVCMEEEISIVFLPCGHLATCVQCAPALTKCPICRTRVKGTVRAFLA